MISFLSQNSLFEGRARVTHQRDDCSIARSNILDDGFLEKAMNPEAVDINERQCGLIGHRLVAEP